MFTKNLLSAALVAAIANAQTDLELGLVPADQRDSLYPEMASYFQEGAEYEGYTWEAHRVKTADGYIKTLFHITGMDADPSYKPTKKNPVLFINGATSNAMSLF